MRINPLRIRGKWTEGYALDVHTLSSEFIGYDEFGHQKFDTVRSPLGEVLYRSKYSFDQSQLAGIVETSCEYLRRWSPPVKLIVPVPPSRARRQQPVIKMAEAIGSGMGYECRTMRKIKKTEELKDIYDYNERLDKLDGAYAVGRGAFEGQSVLVFDDLIRSGATLNALTDALVLDGKAASVYVLVLTRTRSRS